MKTPLANVIFQVLGLAMLCPILDAQAVTMERFEVFVPVRHDVQMDRGPLSPSKNRLQYQLSTYADVQLFHLGPDSTIYLNGLAGTGNSYTSQWNTIYDTVNEQFGHQSFHMRQIYLHGKVHSWKGQLGVIPPVKGKVSNTSLDKDGWIRGTRVVAPLPMDGQLELVSGAIDHLENPNAFQRWEAWNYAEMEWTQAWDSGFRSELCLVQLDGDRILRGEIRRAWNTTNGIPIELSAEIMRNVSASEWAYDLSAKTRLRAVTIVIEASDVPENFGLLGELYNDFFALGRLGMIAVKGPIVSDVGLGWFLKAYAGEDQVRINGGIGYRFHH